MHTRQLVFLALSLLLAGCVTTRGYGDSAYEQGDYNKALDYYETAIKEGERDVELYIRAARASVATGAFSQAERFYAQALKLGAGIDVARELADFYVKTSNYGSAVRLYQYLLTQEKDPRPVYNNIGTALMYAGQPFEAESFLLVAQQLNPNNPTPYLNLGLLYDQHLRQPWKAMGFYACFTELSDQLDPSMPKVRQRLSELRGQWGAQAEAFECGKAYVPAARIPAELTSLKEEMTKIDLEFKESEISKEQNQDVVIEHMVEDVPATSSEGDRRFLIGEYGPAVDAYMRVAAGDLTPLQLSRLGIALIALERHAEAINWLEMSFAKQQTPQTLSAMLRAHKKMSNTTRIRELCQSFQSRADYSEALKECR